MSRYVTSTEALQLRPRLAEYADRDADGQPDAEAIDDAIASAEAVLTGKLLRRYQDSELAASPAEATKVAKDLVLRMLPYLLLEASGGHINETTRDQYLMAVRDAESVAVGALSLGTPGRPDVDRADPIIASLRPASHAGLTHRTLAGWGPRHPSQEPID